MLVREDRRVRHKGERERERERRGRWREKAIARQVKLVISLCLQGSGS